MDGTILVVDDDRKIVELVALYLTRDGYKVLPAYDGEQALVVARRMRPDLIILDLLLPGLDGADVCKALKAESQVPIIMLTARRTDEDKLLGLELGADDYVTKPFNARELLARVHTVLRRMGPAKSPPLELQFGDLAINWPRHEVRVHGRLVNLTPTEFNILATLAQEPGRAFSRDDLLARAFGLDYEGYDRTVDVHVMRLRRKIEPDPEQPRYVVTVPSVGYRFEGHHAP
jgi:DNA-binding response OmpR family regulator